MSTPSRVWVWGQKLTPSHKLILLALAEHANDHHECWPSIRTLARQCGVSERTVQRVLQQFEESNLLKVNSRYTNSGRQSSNEYKLLVCALPTSEKLSPSPKKMIQNPDILSPSGATPDVTDEGDTAVSPPEPPKESLKQPLHFPTQLTDMEKDFVTALILKIDGEIAQTLLDELTDAIECNSIKKNLLSWFNALVERQKLGMFKPTGGIRIRDRRAARNHERQIKIGKECGQKLPTHPSVAREEIATILKKMKTPNGREW